MPSSCSATRVESPSGPDRDTLIRWSVRGAAPFAGIVALAFLVRLVPVLATGGLHGDFTYDDGVYFGSAVALVHGRIPYRDFLLLHPPGILYVLAPFAVLGNVTGSATALAIARVAFMALGAVNTGLVMVVARRWSRRAAIAAGLLYAVMPAAVLVERTTWLIAPQNTLLLLALAVLLHAQASGIPPGPRRSALSGALAGLAVGVQIWGIVPLGVMLTWLAFTSRRAADGWLGRTAAFGAGAVFAVGAVWLPFLLLAGEPLLRYVLVDQLGRPPVHGSIVVRLRALEGLPLNGRGVPSAIVVSVFTALVASITWGGWRRPEVRLPVLLAGAQMLVLFVVPPFAHYAGWIAPTGALAVGGTIAALVPSGARRPRRWAVAGVCATGFTFLLLLAAVHGNPVHIDVASIRADLAGARCVVADSPVLLIETGELERALDNGCPLLLDPSGTSYDVGRGTGLPRGQNAAYQQTMTAYYSEADAVLLVREDHDVFSPASWAAIRGALPRETTRGGVTVLVR